MDNTCPKRAAEPKEKQTAIESAWMWGSSRLAAGSGKGGYTQAIGLKKGRGAHTLLFVRKDGAQWRLELNKVLHGRLRLILDHCDDRRSDGGRKQVSIAYLKSASQFMRTSSQELVTVGSQIYQVLRQGLN